LHLKCKKNQRGRNFADCWRTKIAENFAESVRRDDETVGSLLVDTWRGVAIFRGSLSIAPDEGSVLFPTAAVARHENEFQFAPGNKKVYARSVST